MTIELKNYGNASNARRAAKAAGLSEFDVYADGRWYKIRAIGKPCWDILGVCPGASRNEISNAYRVLAPKHHPDKGGSPKKMKELNIARDAAIALAKPAKAAKASKTAQEPRAHARPEKTTKGNRLFQMVKEGATITELTASLGWQRHTVRAAICRLGKAGYVVQRTKVGAESHYKIAA